MLPTPRTFPILFALVLLATASTPAVAHLGGAPGSGGPYVEPPDSEPFRIPRGELPCDNEFAAWRAATVVEGVEVRASMQCEPDDPRLVAAFVKGTDRMPQELLDDTALHRDAVVKSNDRDGDGDPDVINITLEVSELNGWHLPDDVLAAEGFDIAPGVRPGFWVFSPKSTIHHSGDRFFNLTRMPTPPIRVEVNDTVHLTLENTHYLPHTIHLHGTDHPFLDADGEGNDGVPHISEQPVLPGESRTYELTPRKAGSMFYHCHVHPHVHVMMGLGALFIIEEDRPDNWLQTFNVGGGEVRHPSKASLEEYDREYDLIYQDVDKDLNDLIKTSNDPREIERVTHREYDATERTADYFLLNGRSFPYTLRESVIYAGPDERVKLRVANAGEETVSLHTHGHKAHITHLDGVPVPRERQDQRDVYTITGAQRLDLEVNTTNDGLNAYGPGVWFMHDHREKATTTDGIGPGGDITLIAYESFYNATTGLPHLHGAPLDIFFTEEYYRGELPVFAMLDQQFFGEVAAEETPPDDTPPEAPTPAPAALLVAAALVAAAVAAARPGRWRP